MRLRTLVFGAAAALVAAGSAQAADSVASFYKGKQIRLVVGSAPGGGYDVMARAVARHLGDHIPGHPSIVVQNQPGAASVIMTNALVANGPFDGTAIGAAINGMPTAPLLEPKAAHFDPTKLIWLGSADKDTQIAYVWHTAPVQTLSELRTKQLLVGATNPGTTQVDFPTVADAVLGLKFKVVSGYESTGQIHKAMEAGEVQGVGSTAITSLETLAPQWLKNGNVKILGLWNLTPSPLVPKNTPRFISLAKTASARQALSLMVSRLEYGRPFFLPPGVPADRARALQKAFMDTMKDPAFIADVEKLHLEVDAISGAQVEKLVKDAMATPKPIVKRVRAALGR